MASKPAAHRVHNSSAADAVDTGTVRVRHSTNPPILCAAVVAFVFSVATSCSAGGGGQVQGDAEPQRQRERHQQLLQVEEDEPTAGARGPQRTRYDQDLHMSPVAKPGRGIMQMGQMYSRSARKSTDIHVKKKKKYQHSSFTQVKRKRVQIVKFTLAFNVAMHLLIILQKSFDLTDQRSSTSIWMIFNIYATRNRILFCLFQM